MAATLELDADRFTKTIDGLPVTLYTLRNGKGMVVKITNYGGKVEQILVPDRNGEMGDVALGYDSIDAVLAGQPSMGAFIGRFANRIRNARFPLNGAVAMLSVNAGQHSLHGGTRGSRFRVFAARQLDDSSLELMYVFQDGEEGYPGTLPVRVIYRVTDENALRMEWSAAAIDKETVANFTNHTFFNRRRPDNAGTRYRGHDRCRPLHRARRRGVPHRRVAHGRWLGARFPRGA